MSRRHRRYKPQGGRFALIPLSVLQHEAVRTLHHAEFRVLVLLSAAFNGKNNGALGLTASQAAEAGVGSDKTLYKALRTLESRGLIGQTFPASRVPPRPTMYALEWRALDDTEYSQATRIPRHDYRNWRRDPNGAGQQRNGKAGHDGAGDALAGAAARSDSIAPEGAPTVISDQYSVPSRPGMSTVKEGTSDPMTVLSTVMGPFLAPPWRYSVLASKNIPGGAGQTSSPAGSNSRSEMPFSRRGPELSDRNRSFLVERIRRGDDPAGIGAAFGLPPEVVHQLAADASKELP